MINDIRAGIITLAILTSLAIAESNLDSDKQHAWCENVGWTKWRDANSGIDGVRIDSFIISGFIWGENVGFVNLGDGHPTAAPHYGNDVGTDFGVNINLDGTLYGLAWGEHVGWIDFGGGALATPAQQARIECNGRLTGFAWGENIGWINLSELGAANFVSLDEAFAPVSCDLNENGIADGLDVHAFATLVLDANAASWREVCAGDLEPMPDGSLDFDDLSAFVECLLE